MGLRYTQISIEERCEIARLRATGASVRQIAASLDRAPSTVARELKRNASGTRGYQPRYAEQQARARRWSDHVSNGMTGCAKASCPASSRAGRRSRLPAGLPVRPAGVSYPTRPSTGSSTDSWHARRTIRGATICRGPSRNGAGGDAKAGTRPPSSLCAVRWQNVPRRPLIDRCPATGRPT